MWGSRSETMWKAGPSRRNCSKSCGKWKAASRAVLPSLHDSLGSVKLCEPGQAARGIRSLPGASGHCPAMPPQAETQEGQLENPLGGPWVSGLLPSFSRSCPWGTLLGGWELALAGVSVQPSYQWAEQAARGACVLSLRTVPADELAQSPPVPICYCGVVASDWTDSNCLRIFLFYTILCVSGHDWFH